jgi:DNA-binding SARP family transcriptional activator
MVDLRLFLFGIPRIEFRGEPIRINRRKALALMAYLALEEQRQSREVLANLLWPDLDHEHARSALRSTLHSLTSPVPESWIDSEPMSVALKREVVWVDVNAFTALLSQRNTHSHSRNQVCANCVELFLQAIELYQTDFLAGFNPSYSEEFDSWQRSQRQWLRWEFADIQQRLSEYFGKEGRYDLAIKYGQQWLSLDPLHEPAHRQLMRLFTANEQRSEALRQYSRCVDILDVELATLPEAETRRLYEKIQSKQPLSMNLYDSVDRSSISNVLPPLPSLVIGRDKQLQEIKQRLGIGTEKQHPITVIQGWPGVGKSTIVAKLAHDPEVSAHFPNGILWASFGESPNLLGELHAWVESLIPGESGRARNLDEARAQLTAVLRDRRVLLILDDVWQVEHALPFRVGGQQCALIMTSRLYDVTTALASTAGDIYRLPVLTERAGLELLGELAPQALAEEPTAALELVRDLEGLPLAIHVAGRLLHNEAHLGWGLRELLTELHSGAALLAAPAPSDMHSAGQETSPTVAALLQRSTDLLDEETRRRFAYLGLFVPKPATFDLEAMAVAWAIADPRQTARLLVNRGLLEPVSGGRFQMHALLVMHARSLMEKYRL